MHCRIELMLDSYKNEGILAVAIDNIIQIGNFGIFHNFPPRMRQDQSQNSAGLQHEIIL